MKELIRKFCLEWENGEVVDDLWPWFQNVNYSNTKDNKYQKLLTQYGGFSMEVGASDCFLNEIACERAKQMRDPRNQVAFGVKTCPPPALYVPIF